MIHWQVETVGDKYMTVSGLPEPCTHHAQSICHLALDMMEIAGQVKVDEEPVQVTALETCPHSYKNVSCPFCHLTSYINPYTLYGPMY